MSKKTRLARVDEKFFELVKESGMTTPSYTRKLVKQLQEEKEEELVFKINKKRGFNFKL